MAEETLTIVRIKTDEAVKSVNDLKENIKTLKDRLGDLEVGSEGYQKTLSELKINQNALKDAMYATSGTMEDVAKAATGASESYNSLVHRMASLKEEFRSTEDAARRADIGGQIKEVNDRLKEMDAMQGNFQRNVGNYTESVQKAFKGMAEGFDSFDKALKISNGGLKDFKDVSEGISKSPMIATFGILVSVAIKLYDTLKENDTAMASIRKGMDALKPVTEFIAGIVEKLAEWLGVVITKVTEFLGNSGLIQKVIDGVMGVGNAIVKFITAPFKGVVAAIKVFQEEGIKGIGNAAKAFKEEMKSGVAFKSNYQAGQELAAGISKGVKDSKPEVTSAISTTLKESVDEAVKYALKDWQKELERGIKNANAMDALGKEAQGLLDQYWDEEMDGISDAITGELASVIEAEIAASEQEKEIAATRIATMHQVAASTSSILGSIADMYEADTANSEKNAEKIKALRIASATIDTISGAIGAYMQSCETIPPPYGQIVGIAQAAAITAAGIANIDKIKSTSTSGSSSTTASVSAITSAPSVTTDVTNVRNLTSASEEDRLNQMASDQRVYILSSDIEASQNAVRVQTQESSF